MTILQVAIPTHVAQIFDYLLPSGEKESLLSPGIRVRVPFGKNQTYIGIVVGITHQSLCPPEKLKPIIEILDDQPILSEELLKLLQWASCYYHYPIGEVIATALPTLLNKGTPASVQTLTQQGQWILTEIGQGIEPENLPKSQHRQALLLSLFQKHLAGLSEHHMVSHLSNPRPTLRALQKKGWIIPLQSSVAEMPLLLNAAQEQTVQQVCQHLGQFYPCLLDGVTGSGKTEVYLQIIQKVIDQGHQALILVPEINLTPQMVNRFKQRFTVPIALFHSRLNDQERLEAWLYARDGKVPIVIGTRSAVWTPLKHPGIFIVDEEHDASYKQQESFRYSARDVAVVRAQRAQVPILLGSATPSLDSLYNVASKRYHHLVLSERAGMAVHPTFHIVDLRFQPSRGSLSPQLKKAITQRLANKQQILLFLNRRGYAPILMCYQCGWVAFCEHCDAHLTYHETSKELLCHHCGTTRSLDLHCPKCQHPKVYLVGLGTERVEEHLQKQFSEAKIVRIDSDSTRSRHAMHTLLERIHEGEADILVGTQMLAKGHHFPKVTLVGIINIDGGLYGMDFRATERMAQLLVQVAGRAGRAEEPGEVIIQTHHPHHPLLTRLIRHGYSIFAQAALEERQQAALPPYTRLALLRAEALDAQHAKDFLLLAKSTAQQFNYEAVTLWGPVFAPMKKRMGWYRAQLLLQSPQRESLHQLLSQWLSTLPPSSNKIRWSLDIDPQDLL